MLSLTACGQGAEESSDSTTQLSETTQSSADVLSIMVDEMDPAADGIWQSAGWIITDEGEEELWPTTEEGWQAVAASADNLIQLSAELDAPAYAAIGKPWSLSLVRLTQAAEAARLAAETRDKQGLFDAGGDIYRACLMCHLRYAREADMAGAEDAGEAGDQ
ncbi:hypothetical protein [Parvularcula sp. IMCC14364]|uniref:hypothetical protein n=1 Tax=Parvularcula sp. IMCC14364 TaxID=3067902 RepID=UPI002741BAB9|nr:hypothetical protein [Parvularcula sp. IMCC14364]